MEIVHAMSTHVLMDMSLVRISDHTTIYKILILQEDFEKAAEDAKTQVPDKAANADKLALYGLFKQATVGDVNTGDQHYTHPIFWFTVPRLCLDQLRS